VPGNREETARILRLNYEKKTMVDEKRKALSEINRALGLLEGVSYCAEQKVAEGIMDAVEAIDCNLKVVFEDEKV
jgi:hypothetical protein